MFASVRGGRSPAAGPALVTALDRLQAAVRGGPDLDALLARALSGAPLPAARARWSTDLTATLELVPPDHNVSLGRRDGVCWAWIQPNDRWEPGAHEARHDHPRGSGLIVAHTAALALACAILVLRLRQQRDDA
jgi:hypothetical protein